MIRKYFKKEIKKLTDANKSSDTVKNFAPEMVIAF